MKTYRIATSAELDDGSTRDEVFDVTADEIIVSRSGGVRAYRHQEPPAVDGWWAAFRQRRRLERYPEGHYYDELTCWVPHDTLISARLLHDEPVEDDPNAGGARALRTGGVVGGPIIRQGA